MKKLLFAIIATLMLLNTAFAQFEGSTKKITAEYKSSDVREVIIALLKPEGISYSINPEVQGSVTVSVKDVPLETVLENVLRQVDCTYEVSGGLVVIKKRKQDTILPETNETITQSGKTAKIIRKVFIRSADPLLIAMLLSGNQNYFGSPEPTQSSYTMLGGTMGGFGGFSGQGGFGRQSGNRSGQNQGSN